MRRDYREFENSSRIWYKDHLGRLPPLVIRAKSLTFRLVTFAEVGSDGVPMVEIFPTGGTVSVSKTRSSRSSITSCSMLARLTV